MAICETAFEQMFKFSDNPIDLIESYLIGRAQCGSCRGFRSVKAKAYSGVPRGSVLGPILICLSMIP